MDVGGLTMFSLWYLVAVLWMVFWACAHSAMGSGPSMLLSFCLIVLTQIAEPKKPRGAFPPGWALHKNEGAKSTVTALWSALAKMAVLNATRDSLSPGVIWILSGLRSCVVCGCL